MSKKSGREFGPVSSSLLCASIGSLKVIPLGGGLWGAEAISEVIVVMSLYSRRFVQSSKCFSYQPPQMHSADVSKATGLYASRA